MRPESIENKVAASLAVSLVAPLVFGGISRLLASIFGHAPKRMVRTRHASVEPGLIQMETRFFVVQWCFIFLQDVSLHLTKVGLGLLGTLFLQMKAIARPDLKTRPVRLLLSFAEYLNPRHKQTDRKELWHH